MDLHKEKRTGPRALWLLPGLAIVALCAGPSIASASIIANYGAQYRPGDGDVVSSTNGGSGDQQDQSGDQSSQDGTQLTDTSTGGGNDASNTDSGGTGDNGGGNTLLAESVIVPPPSVPVPEPGPLVLLITGLAGLLLVQVRGRSTARAMMTGAR